MPGGLPVTAQSCPCVDTRHSSAQPRQDLPHKGTDEQEPALPAQGKSVEFQKRALLWVFVPCSQLRAGAVSCLPVLCKQEGPAEPCVEPSSGWQGRHTWGTSTDLSCSHTCPQLPEQSAKAAFDG